MPRLGFPSSSRHCVALPLNTTQYTRLCCLQEEMKLVDKK